MKGVQIANLSTAYRLKVRAILTRDVDLEMPTVTGLTLNNTFLMPIEQANERGSRCYLFLL